LTPHQVSISAEGKDLYKAVSPAMRNAWEAFIRSTFFYLADQLTVFPDAGIAGKHLPLEIPPKSFAWKSEGKNIV
jgi:hypothetical protein